jgi:hypothetical protein
MNVKFLKFLAKYALIATMGSMVAACGAEWDGDDGEGPAKETLPEDSINRDPGAKDPDALSNREAQRRRKLSPLVIGLRPQAPSDNVSSPSLWRLPVTQVDADGSIEELLRNGVTGVQLNRGHDGDRGWGLDHIVERHARDYINLGLTGGSTDNIARNIAQWLHDFLSRGRYSHMATGTRNGSITAHFQYSEHVYLVVAIAPQDGRIISAYPKEGTIPGMGSPRDEN